MEMRQVLRLTGILLPWLFYGGSFLMWVYARPEGYVLPAVGFVIGLFYTFERMNHTSTGKQLTRLIDNDPNTTLFIKVVLVFGGFIYVVAQTVVWVFFLSINLISDNAPAATAECNA